MVERCPKFEFELCNIATRMHLHNAEDTFILGNLLHINITINTVKKNQQFYTADTNKSVFWLNSLFFRNTPN